MHQGTVFVFDPEVSIDFDKERELYVGVVNSHRGIEMVEGPDRFSVMFQIEELLMEIHNEMERSIEQDKEVDAGVSSSSGQQQAAPYQPEPEHSHGILDKAFMAMGVSKASQMMVDLFTALLMGFGLIKAHKFVAVVAGKRITAKSRRKLKKAVALQRQKNIQRVMLNVREQQKSREHALESAKRIRKKKHHAITLGRESWEKRVASDRPRSDWQGRAGDLRRHVRTSRDKSRDLWAASDTKDTKD